MYEFTLSAFLFGLVVLAGGGAITVFYRQLANNLANGLSSYDKFKKWGLILCGVGFIIMTGLHTIPLNWLVDTIFVR